MFKSITVVALFCLASASAGLIETHHVIQEPVLTKIGSVVHSAPSAVSHQSFTRVHNKAVVSPIVAPIVKTTVHAHAPITKTLHTYETAPAIHTYAAAPALHTTYAAAPVVHAAPIVHSADVVHSAPVVHSSHDLYSNQVVHSAPVLKSFAPATYTLHH